MRRVFWVGVGVAITVVVVVRGKRVVARLTPASVADRATARADEIGGRALQAVRDFRTEFVVARDERERELLAALLAEGQEDPEAVRRRRAAGRHTRPVADDPATDVDDVEELLGYSF
ncbi:hypothetical protein [Cellulosimicrobium arenosum]|uniref:Secreted protein n=1 Tax=Cellulosimicrobium arenosum TaxID=2708133 RepID=A0A927IWZ1_9MICO|nr:hypothetical protein [Cellulosimicrobium arenosum]MBD8077886.1 hypothetical protein [Cellulosimicrobium arenosum]